MYIPVAFCKLKSMFAINTHVYCVASIFTDAQIPIPTTGLDRIHCVKPALITCSWICAHETSVVTSAQVLWAPLPRRRLFSGVSTVGGVLDGTVSACVGFALAGNPGLRHDDGTHGIASPHKVQHQQYQPIVLPTLGPYRPNLKCLTVWLVVERVETTLPTSVLKKWWFLLKKSHVWEGQPAITL